MCSSVFLSGPVVPSLLLAVSQRASSFLVLSVSAALEGQCALVHTMHVQLSFLFMTSLPTLMSTALVEMSLLFYCTNETSTRGGLLKFISGGCLCLRHHTGKLRINEGWTLYSVRAEHIFQRKWNIRSHSPASTDDFWLWKCTNAVFALKWSFYCL